MPNDPLDAPIPSPSPSSGEGNKLPITPERRAQLTEIARQFRKEPTRSEDILWQALRGKKLDGRKFRRQQPIGTFVVDFFCPSEKLIVEVDGSIHAEQVEADAARQELIESAGYRFVRVTAHNVEHNLPNVLTQIKDAFLPSPAAGRGAGGEGIFLQITPEGTPSQGSANETIIPRDDEAERKILAKRLVADRCIYGVDKNPLAVEMGKLSLWLTTLSKGRAFTFLDHALKCGDSLVGVSMEQLRYWKLQPERDKDGKIIDAEQMVGRFLQPVIDYAIDKRRQLESFTVVDVNDQQAKAALYAEAEAATAYLKTAADHLIAETMGVSAGSVLADVVATFKAMADEDDLIAALRDHPLNPPDGLNFPPFHWELEYPEVFQRGGFDAFVDNPPFIGGGRISTSLGDTYYQHLKEVFPALHGQADICALFFLRIFDNINLHGTYGLIATNTISQGDTREVGLDNIVSNGGEIINATESMTWPGSAAVTVSVLHIYKGQYLGTRLLNNEQVENISPLLNTIMSGNPKNLVQNTDRAFRGMDMLGTGFTLTPDQAQVLIEKEAKNKDVLFPYMNGRDLNSSVTQVPSRWAIYFHDWSLEHAEQYEDCMGIVRREVYLERQQNNNKKRREVWWLFDRPRVELWEILSGMKRVIACSRVTKNLIFSFVPTGQIFSDAMIVFASEKFEDYSIIQSSLHDTWAWQYSSTMRNAGIRYSPSDAFETFPFPTGTSSLEAIGERYHETRRQIMLARQEGLTATYNRFHDPDESAEDIQHLRALHVEMDEAVAAAYGWDDLDLGHDFHETAQGVRFTISEAARREVLTRLLKLNHARYAQECHEGLHKPKDCAAFFAEHPEYQRKVDWDAMMKRKKIEDQSEEPDHADEDNPQKRLL